MRTTDDKIRDLASKAESDLLIVGGGGHGRVVAETARLTQHFSNIVVIDPLQSTNWPLPSFKCVQSESMVDASPESWSFVPAVGDSYLRKKLYSKYVGMGFQPATIIHPKASVSCSASIGKGVVVFAGAVIAAMSQVGDCAIINHNAVVEHDCVVGSFAHIAPGAVMGGSSKLGDGSFLGACANLRHKAEVAKDVVIGNGAAVVSNISLAGTYVGVPAKKLFSSSKAQRN